jgi:mannose-6-phosphate isomerase
MPPPLEPEGRDAAAELSAARELYARLRHWLLESALPLWAQQGYDFVHGGFQERLTEQGPVSTDPRRARVQVRQVFVFANAPQLGWRGDPLPLVQRGLGHFLARYRRSDGLFRTLCAPDGTVLDERALLYDQAFVLLALAESQKVLGPRADLTREAGALLANVQKLLKRPGLGFDSGIPERLPLLANPHMHLLEAALAWRERSDAAVWRELIEELTVLALTRLIDPGQGVLLERFGADWLPVVGDEGRVVEPGHLFEWAWLLQRCGGAAATEAAARLIRVGEQHGVRGGITVNALRDDFIILDADARLWPQTERLKANARLAPAQPLHWAAVLESGRVLTRYLEGVPPGLWHDRLRVAGGFVAEPSPASSLYHIVVAIQELGTAVGDARLAAGATDRR